MIEDHFELLRGAEMSAEVKDLKALANEFDGMIRRIKEHSLVGEYAEVKQMEAQMNWGEKKFVELAKSECAKVGSGMGDQQVRKFERS